MMLPLIIQAETDRFSENDIKAAYLYNFAKFVEWPAASFNTPNAPIILCILGSPPFDKALKTIQNKPVRDRLLLIRHCRNIEDLEGCHMLFVSDSEKENMAAILSRVKNQPILTISDIDGFVNSGGIIKFIRSGNKIRFEVNVGAAEKASIKISSRMLKIAQRIE